jgi:hypothetical protein
MCHPFVALRAGSERGEGSGGAGSIGLYLILHCVQDDSGGVQDDSGGERIKTTVAEY